MRPFSWIASWYFAISSAISFKLVVYDSGSLSVFCSSIMVSQLFFSFPWVHQYLFTNLPWRCQFAFTTILLWLWQIFWTSWIFSVMELAISRAWVSHLGSFWLTSCRILFLLFVRVLIVEFIFPAFIFSMCLANMHILFIRSWRCLCGLWVGPLRGVCVGFSAIFSMDWRKCSSSIRYLGRAHLPLPMLGTWRSYSH